LLLLLCLISAAGGKLVVQYQKKPTKHARCGATGVVLHGVSSWLWHSLGHLHGAQQQPEQQLSQQHATAARR
jgi:ribosomal protein L34E